MNPEEIPTITLPLKEFLEYLWGNKDKSEVTHPLAKVIASLDPNSLYCHVQDCERVSEAPPYLPLYRIWRIKDWKFDSDRHKLDQDRSDKKRIANNRQRQTLSELRDHVEITLRLPEDLSMMMAKELYRSGNVRDAKTHFDYDMVISEEEVELGMVERLGDSRLVGE